MNRRANIGFDRRIDLEWLDAAADKAALGAAPAEMRTHLWNVLKDVISGDKLNSARGKTVTVLNHIWGEVPERATELRDRAIAQLPSCTAAERLSLHWAMMLGTYPIFTDIAGAVGRLLRLQGSFTLAQLTRRLVAVWGQRSTVERAAQRIVRSMILWDVLQETAPRGTYSAASPLRPVGAAVGKVLIEALLIDADQDSIPLDQLIGHPAVFPFEIRTNVRDVRDSPEFRVHREGLDSDFVELRVPRATHVGHPAGGSTGDEKAAG